MYDEIGMEIKIARTRKGWTQTQLGQKIRKTQRTISQYETGSAVPGGKALIELCHVLDIDINKFKGKLNNEKNNEKR